MLTSSLYIHNGKYLSPSIYFSRVLSVNVCCISFFNVFYAVRNPFKMCMKCAIKILPLPCDLALMELIHLLPCRWLEPAAYMFLNHVNAFV